MEEKIESIVELKKQKPLQKILDALIKQRKMCKDFGLSGIFIRIDHR
jgi:hypothetical protein